MTTDQQRSDPWAWRDLGDVGHASADASRIAWLRDPEPASCRAAVAGLANASGGHAVIGALPAINGSAATTPGVPATWATTELPLILAQIDPPLTGLVTWRSLETSHGRDVVIIAVRQSPRCPHLDTESGTIYVHQASGAAVVTSRNALDQLYRRGRIADERAERSIEGMAERLQLASFGHYGLAIIACLRKPSAAPFVEASTHPEMLVNPSDPFVKGWEFSTSMLRTRSAELELRGEREITGVLRLSRAGCVTAGETRKKPSGEILGTRTQLEDRIRILIDTACRVLSPAEDPLVAVRAVYEGLRGARLQIGDGSGEQSLPATHDSLAEAGPAGDSSDPSYREALVQYCTGRLVACFPFKEPGKDPDKAPKR